MRRAKVRLGHNFHQRHAAAVVVAQCGFRPGVVHQFARVLFHVDFVQANVLFLPAVGRDRYAAARADRRIELRNLISLRQVGVKIVFAVKARQAGDLAAERQAGAHRALHHRAVEHGKRTGLSGADRTGVRVGCAAEGCGTAAEDLCLGIHFDMDFESADDFILHFSAPPCTFL